MTACLNPPAIIDEDILPATRPLMAAIIITGGRKKCMNSAVEMLSLARVSRFFMKATRMTTTIMSIRAVM
jgi:hypothetical protein